MNSPPAAMPGVRGPLACLRPAGDHPVRCPCQGASHSLSQSWSAVWRFACETGVLSSARCGLPKPRVAATRLIDPLSPGPLSPAQPRSAGQLQVRTSTGSPRAPCLCPRAFYSLIIRRVARRAV
jgi:hypothetical protein